MLRYYNITVAILILVCAAAFALESDEWAAYTSMRDIRDLLYHRNAVWAITAGGVLRFDQQSQTYARFTRLDGLAGNQVSSVASDARGHLWFGTDRQGLSRFRPDDGVFDPPFREFEELDVKSLAASGDRLFVGTDLGISAFLIDKEEVKETYRQLGRLVKDTEVNALAVYAGMLWAGTPRGLARADLGLPNLQDPDSWTVISIGEVRGFLLLADTLYCNSPQGVWHLAGIDDRPSLELSGENIIDLTAYRGQAAAVTAEGTILLRRARFDWRDDLYEPVPGAHAIAQVDTALWAATGEGLRIVGAEPPPPAREPAANYFYEMALTEEGHLWVASVPKDNIVPFGAYEFDGEGWNVHNYGNGLPSNFAADVETDATGRIWVGTWGEGVAVRDSAGTWRVLDQTNSVLRGIGSTERFVAISDIVRDRNGLMWVANVRIGLAVFDGYPPARSRMYGQLALGMPPGRDIGELAIDPDGIKWISTPVDGFILFDDGGTPFEGGDEFALQFNTISQSRMSSDRTSDILVDQRGRIWVATDNGLNFVRGTYSRAARSFQIDEWRVYNTANGLPANAVTALEEGAHGTIWVGTESGLAQITPAGEVAFALTTENSGLIDNRINSLLFDSDNGELWIGTLDGLARLRVDPGGNQVAGAVALYPNPFHLGDRSSEMAFAGLPLGAALDIFTLNGRLIRHLDGTPGQGTVQWNGLNEAGFLVSSGIYLFVARNESGSTVRGKFAVINDR